jgi:hypothetical protein
MQQDQVHKDQWKSLRNDHITTHGCWTLSVHLRYFESSVFSIQCVRAVNSTQSGSSYLYKISHDDWPQTRYSWNEVRRILTGCVVLESHGFCGYNNKCSQLSWKRNCRKRIGQYVKINTINENYVTQRWDDYCT